MSRSGYDDSGDNWATIKWRGAVASAIRGRRGQAFLREMLAALDAMPDKRLIKNELIEPNYVSMSHWGLHEGHPSVCAIGSVGAARGLDMSQIEPTEREDVAEAFGIAPALAAEIVYENDESYYGWKETPEHRFERMRAWVVSQINSP